MNEPRGKPVRAGANADQGAAWKLTPIKRIQASSNLDDSV